MLLATANDIPGKPVLNTLGIAPGSVVPVRHVGSDIVGLRFTTSMIASGAAEILAYGAAVVVEE